jgi:hypothetical protein
MHRVVAIPEVGCRYTVISRVMIGFIAILYEPVLHITFIDERRAFTDERSLTKDELTYYASIKK